MGFSKIEFRGDEVSLRILWGDIMGVRSIEICKRKALELWGSNRFDPRMALNVLTPVILPPSLLRLATKPKLRPE